MPKTKLKNYFLLHFIVFIWGFTAILGALISIQAIPLVWFRMAMAVVFIWIYFLFKKRLIKIDLKTMMKFLAGGIIIALHWITFFTAIKVSNVSVTLVTMSTGAFFTALIEPLFFKRKLSFLEVFFGVLVILGLYLIFNFKGTYILGITYALISSFLSALFSVINGLLVKRNDATVISFYELLFGVLFISVFIGVGGGFDVSFFQLSVNDWFYLFILSSICTAYAFVVSTKVMKYLSPYTVMLTINLEPVYGILLALLVFGEKEKMDAKFYYGTLIILLVVFANGIVKNRTGKKIK